MLSLQCTRLQARCNAAAEGHAVPDSAQNRPEPQEQPALIDRSSVMCFKSQVPGNDHRQRLWQGTLDCIEVLAKVWGEGGAGAGTIFLSVLGPCPPSGWDLSGQ